MLEIDVSVDIDVLLEIDVLVDIDVLLEIDVLVEIDVLLEIDVLVEIDVLRSMLLHDYVFRMTSSWNRLVSSPSDAVWQQD